MTETKLCKFCKTEIPKDAKICPNCKKKQKGKLGIIICIILILVIIGAATSGGNNKSISSDKSTKTESTDSNNSKAKEATIEYTSVSKQELSDALTSNALKASDTYKGQYLEVTGYLSVIDSSGKYISIDSGGDDFSFVNVQCFIKNDEQKAIIMEMNKGDAITIKGKCTDVGEVLGYSIDIDEVITN